MELAAPIYQLKREAKRLSRKTGIALHAALDQVAANHGCASWSLLLARHAAATPAIRLFNGLAPGDLLLLGARPGQGKTLLSLELAVQAMKHGRRATFFTLEYTEDDVRDRFADIGADLAEFDGHFVADCSEDICAGHIKRAMTTADRGALAVVDYLQALDQQRTKPELSVQIHDLKAFATERGLILVFISQIDRSYDPSRKACPDLADVRLPNPLDVGLFDKRCFLHAGKVRIHAT